jgi:single-stranded-DNA-specific exonuclease
MVHTRFIRRCEAAPSFSGFPDWFSSLLRARGIETDEEARRFLNPSLSGLHDPFLLPGMQETVDLLRQAIAKGDTILVYGDYDVDGICAASILMETLHEEGASLAYRIPSRHSEGYGLNPDAVREVAQKAKLLITVDCGVSNVEEVALAKELGLTVIVTDHHQPPEILPAADVVMDPHLSGYPFPHLCGAGVALKISQALQGMAGVEKRLDLAALATVADIVPLRDENRVIVREGLPRIAATSRPGLKALLKAAGVEPPVTADHLAFRLAPRLNAAGRLGDAKLGVHLLLTPDPAKADNIARLLEEANRTRQGLEREMTASAVSQLSLEALAGAHVVIVSGEDWNPGLIGLTAGRLCERFHLPVIALSLHGDTAVGSCRSIPGVNIYRMLSACADLLEQFGGHEQAAGLTVKAGNIPLLHSRLEEVISASAPEECFLPSMEYDLVVPFRTWTLETLALLDLLEPTGCGNPPPLFLLQDAEVRSLRRVGKDGTHLKLTVIDEDLSSVDGIAFSQGDVADESPTVLNLLYRPVRNDFRGRVSIEAQVAAINYES